MQYTDHAGIAGLVQRNDYLFPHWLGAFTSSWFITSWRRMQPAVINGLGYRSGLMLGTSLGDTVLAVYGSSVWSWQATAGVAFVQEYI